MYNKRGQAAMEFLMTYGWALLVVLVSLGSLIFYFGYDNTTFVTESCFLGPGLSCSDMKVEGDTISMKVKNSMGKDMTDFLVTHESCTGPVNSVPLKNNEEALIILTGCTFVPGELIKESLQVKYTFVNSNLDHEKDAFLVAVVEGVDDPGGEGGGGEGEGDAVCGNSVIETGESCDDGNLVNGDGCNDICLVEEGYSCEGEPSVCINGGSTENVNMGMNFVAVNYYSRAIPFVNIMNQADNWRVDGDYNYRIYRDFPEGLDSNGWPKQAPMTNGLKPMTLIMVGAEGYYPAGDYTLILTGTGSLKVKGDLGITQTFSAPGTYTIPITPSSTGLTLIMLVSDVNDPMKIAVTLPGHESNYLTSPFNPQVISQLEGFSVIRMMDFLSTNLNPSVSWNDRTTPDHAIQGREIVYGTTGYTGDAGASLEYAVDICNTANTDCWFNVPHAADDNYVASTASLIKNRLDPSLKIYLEYSNEVWNGGFGSCDPDAPQQNSYAEWQGVYGDYCGIQTNWCSTQPSGGPYYSPDQPANDCDEIYYLKRSLDVFKIFEDEFVGEEDRVINVLAWQTVGTYQMNNMLTWASDPNSFTNNLGSIVNLNPHGVAIEAISLAPYIGGNIGNSIVNPGSTTPEQVLVLLEQEIPTAEDRIQGYLDLAQTYGIPQVIAYEGGQHLVGVGGAYQNNQVLTELLTATNRLPGMEQVYDAYYDMWYNLVGSNGIFATFSYLGEFTKYGSWGNLEYLDQNPCSAPKWISTKRHAGMEVC